MLGIITALFLIVTVLMIIAILMQSSKNDALGAGFGALGGSQVFGGRGANDFLKKFTKYLAVLFFALTIGLSFLHRGNNVGSSENALLKDAQENAAPVQTEQPATDLNLPVEASSDSTK